MCHENLTFQPNNSVSSLQSEGFLVAVVAVSFVVLVNLPSNVIGLIALLAILGSILILANASQQKKNGQAVMDIPQQSAAEATNPDLVQVPEPEKVRTHSLTKLILLIPC